MQSEALEGLENHFKNVQGKGVIQIINLFGINPKTNLF